MREKMFLTIGRKYSIGRQLLRLPEAQTAHPNIWKRLRYRRLGNSGGAHGVLSNAV
jgi:hypothetical protein